MPIAVRTNVAFDSHSSRLVRKKAARTEAGVVVLESPAIVQERLAPLSFSNSNGRQLATLDLVGVVSALTDPDAGRRAEVARYLLLQAHQRQPSDSTTCTPRSSATAGRRGGAGWRPGAAATAANVAAAGAAAARGGSLAGVATAAVAGRPPRARRPRGGEARRRRRAAGKPMDSKERDEIIAELREYADALGRELRKRGAAARGGKPDARAASGDGVIEIRPEAAMLDTLRAGSRDSRRGRGQGGGGARRRRRRARAARRRGVGGAAVQGRVGGRRRRQVAGGASV